MFELILRIREAVGPEMFLDAVAIIASERPPPPPPHRRRGWRGERRAREVGADVGGGAGGVSNAR